MDDKQLKTLMEEYFNEKYKGDKEKDLEKLKDKDLKNKVNFFTTKAFYATLSCLLVIVVSLSIILPIALKNDDKGSTIRYYDDTEIIYVNVDKYEDLYNNFNSQVLIPNVVSLECLNRYVYSKNDNSFLGVKSEMAVYNENFDIIRFWVLDKNSKLSYLNSIEFENNYLWEDVNVGWSKITNEICQYTFSFEKGDYFYYYTIETIFELEIDYIINVLFA